MKSIILLALLVFIICAYPVLFITPYYPASADAVTTTSMRIMGNGIPETYAPFSDIAFTYQPGFPLFALLFYKLLPVIPDYLWAWLLGCFFSVLQLIGIYLLAKELFDSRAAEWCAILFVGTKLIYENLYVGEYSWLMASAIMLFFFYFLHRKSKAAYLLLPAIFITHPAIALNTMIFLFVYSLFYRQSARTFIGLSVAAIFGVLLTWNVYGTILSNIFSGGAAAYTVDLFLLLLIIPSWIGFVPFVLFSIACLLVAHNNLIMGGELIKGQKLCLTLFLISLLIMTILFLMPSMLHGRVIELMIFSVVLFGGSFMALLTTGRTPITKVAVLILCLVIIFSSGILNEYKYGDADKLDNLEFVEAFKKYDPDLETTLFLTDYPGKMAEFSNKISYDMGRGTQLSVMSYLKVDNAAMQEYENRRTIKKAIEDGCIDCIYDLDVKYVVLNRELFPYELELNPVMEWKQFVLYEKGVS